MSHWTPIPSPERYAAQHFSGQGQQYAPGPHYQPTTAAPRYAPAPPLHHPSAPVPGRLPTHRLETTHKRRSSLVNPARIARLRPSLKLPWPASGSPPRPRLRATAHRPTTRGQVPPSWNEPPPKPQGPGETLAGSGGRSRVGGTPIGGVALAISNDSSSTSEASTSTSARATSSARPSTVRPSTARPTTPTVAVAVLNIADVEARTAAFLMKPIGSQAPDVANAVVTCLESAQASRRAHVRLTADAQPMPERADRCQLSAPTADNSPRCRGNQVL